MLSPFRSTFTRAANAWRVGWRAAISAFNAQNFVPEADYGWDDYEARLARYAYNRFYVHNTVYSDLNTSLATFRKSQNLYRLIRGLRNPVSRLVNIEKAKTLGGFINYETFKDGALPISGADDALLDAIRTIWQWSNMDRFKNLLVYDGASMGDVAIKVIDDTRREKVYLEVLDPRKVKHVKFDNLGNVKEILISYQRYDQTKTVWYEYSELWKDGMVATFYNEQPYAYVEDESGMPVAKWENPYGFLPFEWIKHQDVGQAFGATSFHNTRSKIDNLNDLVSLIHDSARIAFRPVMTLTGKNPRRNQSTGALEAMNLTSDERDKTAMLYLGEDGQLKSIGTELDIPAALLTVNAMMEEIENDLPQLALQKIRNNANDVSGVAIENAYSDGTDILYTLQGTYRAALASATRMAVSVASFRRYDGFRAYNLNSYENGLLDFDIRPMPVFQDKISKEKSIELSLQAVDSDGSEVILKQLGWDDKDIETLQASKQQKTRQLTRKAMREQANAQRAQVAAERLSANGGNTQARQAAQALEEDVNNAPEL